MAFVDDRGDLKKNTLVPEDASNDITIGALHYDYDTDFGTVSLIAGYQDKNNASVRDQTAFLGLQALGIPFVGSQSQAVEGYSPEIRFASTSGRFFDYLLARSVERRVVQGCVCTCLALVSPFHYLIIFSSITLLLFSLNFINF